MKVITGPEKKSRIVLYHDKLVTAYHESGHAVAAYNLKTQDKVHQVTIIQRGMAAGLTVTRPDNDDRHVSRNQMRESIVMLLEKMSNTQIILTSHNTNLLTNRIMRPDCYFILTKDKLTSIVNATDRELREGHNLEKLYMSGEFNG